MKGIDFVNKKVSKDMEVKESIVKAVNSFYWSDAIKEMHKMENPAVFLTHIGTFYVNIRSVRKLIYASLHTLRYIKQKYPDTYTERYRWQIQSEKLKNQWNVKKELMELYEKEKNRRQDKERNKQRG